MGGRALSAGDHSKKEVRKVLKQIMEMQDPSFELVEGGHWGTLICSNGCCRVSVDGTPKSAQRHAQRLLQEAKRCPRDDGDIRKRSRWRAKK